MLGSHRAGEITYYEELGVASRASSEEIRNAFRALARLLHPDQHTDVELKKVAEAQMRKLNRIYAVLSDPESRRQYDEFLDEENLPAVVASRPFLNLNPVARRRLSKTIWAAAMLCGAGLLIWFTAESQPGSQNRGGEQSSQAHPVTSTSSSETPTSEAAKQDQTSLIARLRSDLRAATTERDAAVHELGRLRGTEIAETSNTGAQTETAEIRLPALAMTELPAPAKLSLSASLPQSRTEKPVTRKLAGFWFYAQPSHGQHNKNQSLYPPEYIEATISEENGTIYGKYRARFEIVDRAISPDVNFTFTGTSSMGAQATFPWTGAGGAKGELTLKLVSENSLRIDWSASELGTQQGLDAGTAILTRRIE